MLQTIIKFAVGVSLFLTTSLGLAGPQGAAPSSVPGATLTPTVATTTATTANAATSAATATTAGGPATTSSHVYWGAILNGSAYGSTYGDAPYDLRTWNLFEAHTGKKVAILSMPQAWYGNSHAQGFPATPFNTIRSRGAIPFLTWNSMDSSGGSAQSAFALRNITNGAQAGYGGETFDQFVTQWATGAKNWGHPFFLRFDQEMNGWWQFPWATAVNPHTGVTINNNKPQDYISAWQHVRAIFTRVGATNVTWVWCPNDENPHSTPLAQVYPGASSVDWVGLDGYNNSASSWQSFAQVFSGDKNNGFHNSYADITGLAPTKPLALCEFGSLEANDGGAKKAAWIADGLTTQMTGAYSKIKAIIWFNGHGMTNGGAPYQIESTSLAQNAFATAVQSSYYATNSFGSLSTSPIPALP